MKGARSLPAGAKARRSKATGIRCEHIAGEDLNVDPSPTVNTPQATRPFAETGAAATNRALFAKAGPTYFGLERSPLRQLFEAFATASDVEAARNAISLLLRPAPEAAHLRFYYEGILQRPPESAEIADRSVKNPGRVVLEMLESPEFIRSHIEILLREFRHVRRDLFVHIPKCGGTLVKKLFSERSGCCNFLTPDAIFDGFRPAGARYWTDLARALTAPSAQNAFVSGHLHAKTIVEKRLKRPCDRVFTVLRDPLESAASMINYVLTRLQTPDAKADRARWLQLLELASDYVLRSSADAELLVPRVVEKVLARNPICESLGQEPTMLSSLEVIRILAIDVVPYANLNVFLADEGLATDVFANISIKFVSLDNIDRALLMKLYEKNQEDISLYDAVIRQQILSPKRGRDHSAGANRRT